MFIREYMSTNVITIDSRTLMHDAEKMMHDHGIRRLPVVDKGKLTGIITRDKIREATGHHATSLARWELNYLLAKMKVRDIMETNLFTVTPDTTVEESVNGAHDRGIGTLIVVDNDNPSKLVGIATTTDLYKIITSILGFGQKGIWLHIINPNQVGSCEEVAHLIIHQGHKILSLFHVSPPGLGKEDCIIHLETGDATTLVNELKSEGYEVEARSSDANKSETQSTPVMATPR